MGIPSLQSTDYYIRIVDVCTLRGVVCVRGARTSFKEIFKGLGSAVFSLSRSVWKKKKKENRINGGGVGRHKCTRRICTMYAGRGNCRMKAIITLTYEKFFLLISVCIDRYVPIATAAKKKQ